MTTQVPSTATLNGQEVALPEGESLNAIQLALRAGVEIPHYCWHPALSVVASCRMCLVEAGQIGQGGVLAMQPKLVPACQTPVKPGTVIVTNSEKVKAAQNQVLEFLLLNHPLDCPVCDQAGECKLQDFSFRYGRGYSRLKEPKVQKPDKDYIGDQITLFTDRCVMCTRCVRFTREISGTGELQVIQRGSHAEIDIFPGEPCDNKLAGNVVDICPVGALCSKDFLYKQRVWWLESKESVCPNCSTGCSIHVDQNENVVYRLKPRHNPQSQGHFMCDEGRFGFKYQGSPNRLKHPLVRGENGSQAPAIWDHALRSVRNGLQQIATSRPASLLGILSPWMTVEEAYLLASYLKSLSPEIRLALGPLRVEGEDDRYPKDVHGRAVEPTKFTIRAEKAPNVRGVEAVLRHFEGGVIPAEQLLPAVGTGEIEAVYFAGGDPDFADDADFAATLATAKFLIVQDILASPVSEAADYVLPGGTFMEKDGTFINHAGLAQAIRRAVRGPEEARPDGRILWELSGRTGLFHAANLRKEIAANVPELAALAVGDLGAFGVRTSIQLEGADDDRRSAAEVAAGVS
ncbi:MAG TPA: molybdopterin-dependent oxidoreductase [Pirellulaceae bacterium]|jgi:NADH-quinone oxidoreductase subunit G|nr:molybdopterin-dependent oxidoreductase [Pirellulaceae bacterium]